MIPEVQRFSKEYYITEMFAEPSVDEAIQKALINEDFHDIIKRNISEEDSVTISKDTGLNSYIKVEGDSSIPIDAVKLPNEYIKENDIDNPPALEFFFIHKRDNMERFHLEETDA